MLSYIDNGEKYFFYADIDAHNIRLFREFVSAVNGNSVTQRAWNFIPENEIADIFHSYERTLNDAPDTLTFSADDYTLKRTYTDEKGVKHENVEIDWYPV